MPKPARTRLRGGAAVCLALLLLGACSANPAPKAISSSTPSATPSASTDGPPTLPPEARGTSKQAAVAFVRYYVDLLNYSQKSLASAPARRYSAAGCDACAAITSSVDHVRYKGGHFEGGQWTVREARTVPAADPHLTRVQMVVTYPSQKVFESRAARPLRFRPGRTFYNVDLRPGRGTWVVVDLVGV
jgi:hypothetical protein